MLDRQSREVERCTPAELWLQLVLEAGVRGILRTWGYEVGREMGVWVFWMWKEEEGVLSVLGRIWN